MPSGYIAQAYGWRWSFWVTSIIVGVVCLLIIFFLEESKYVRAIEESHSTQSESVDHEVDKKVNDVFVESVEYQTEPTDTTMRVKSYKQRLAIPKPPRRFKLRAFLPLFYRPFIVLYRFPVLLSGAIMYGFYIAAMNILAVTQTTLYSIPPYSFGTIGVANMNVPPAIGAVLGSAFGGPLVDRTIVYFATKNRGIYEPEMRLWLFAVPASSMLAGILLYGLAIAQVCQRSTIIKLGGGMLTLLRAYHGSSVLWEPD